MKRPKKKSKDLSDFIEIPEFEVSEEGEIKNWNSIDNLESTSVFQKLDSSHLPGNENQTVGFKPTELEEEVLEELPEERVVGFTEQTPEVKSVGSKEVETGSANYGRGSKEINDVE